MKKIFKIGCGCLGVFILIIVILIVIAECNSPGCQSARNEANEEASFSLPYDETVNWERKTAEVENTSARDYLKNYLKENGLFQGFNSKKKTFCYIANSEFELKCSPSDRAFVMHHANQIRRAALKAVLENLEVFAKTFDKKEIETEKIENGEKITAVAELRLKNIVFKGKSVATQQTFVNGKDVKTVATITEERSLSYKGNKLLEYGYDAQGEKYIMHKISVYSEQPLSDADRYSFLQPFLNLLISDGLPVVMEHTAYSWDEKHKRGQVALLLVYKVNPDKKDR